MTSAQQTGQAALEFYKSGNLPEAERLFLQILAAEPNHFPARHLLGVIRHRQGRNREALELIGTALALNPNFPAALLNYGFVLKAMGRLEEAMTYYDKAIAQKPDYAHAYNNRGAVLHELGRLEEALASYDKATQLKPDYAEAWNNRGNLLQDLGHPGDAALSYDKAIAAKPDYAGAYYNRGLALQTLKRPEDALASYDKAIERKPDYAEAFNNRSDVLLDLHRLDEALASAGKAITLRPDYAQAYSNRGNILTSLSRLDEALAAHVKAIELAPDNAPAHMNKAMTELLAGDLAHGWKSFEWRRRIPGLSRKRIFAEPSLTSLAEAEGKTVLVHYEQGFGDTIQLCRYLEPLHQAGARVLFSPQKSLIRLMTSLGDFIHFADVDDPSLSFDFHLPLLSLPLLFGTTLESIPAKTPYLSADTELVRQWRERLGNAGFKIGICWQGNSTHQKIDRRCFSPAHLQPLSGGVRLISLQKGDGEEKLQLLPPGMTVETLGPGFDAGPDAFADTAAVMACLDLVITTDTSIAHLAGALGIPTWLALQQVPDWRWMLDRSDSPWYPSMRLFRQKAEGDWAGVFAAMKEALSHLRCWEPEPRGGGAE